MLPRSLCGKKIRLSCTLKDKQGELLGKPGSVLVVGKNLSIKLAKQLLAGDSARIVENRASKPISDHREWPEPVLWDPFKVKGKATARTISVHIPTYLDGKTLSWLKMHAAPTTFCKLHERWFRTVSERRLGMLVLKAILAGSGNVSSSQQAPVPSGIDILEIKSTRSVQRGRSATVTILINQDGEPLPLKFLAEKDVFQRLSSFHYGDQPSDTRFGYLIREAVSKARDHVRRSQLFKRKDSGRPLQRIAWSTAAWLGPGLLEQLSQAYEGHHKVIGTIRAHMADEKSKLKLTAKNIAIRNMAAFLVHKNWQNWRERISDRVKIPQWPTKTSPIVSPAKKNPHQSGDFWDEIFSEQVRSKRRSSQNSGPTFILPKSLEETVDDILLNRDVFILSH
jgi:hypothetical protein